MERLIRNDFFQNPFGGGMNPMGGGSNGVLETIQQQVMNNGQALQSLQSGIGGLPSGNLPTGGIGGNPADLYEKSQPGGGFNPEGDTIKFDKLEPASITTVGDTAEVGKQQEGMPVGNVGFTDDQLRAEYDELVASAKKRRAEGFMGRVVLPGENLSFEEFKKMQIKPGMPFNMLGGPMQSDIFNVAKAEPNPGMDYSQFTPTIGNLYNDINTGAPQILDNYVPTDIFDVNGQQGFLNQASLSEPRLPTGALRGAGMDQLFGRAFAGKPV